MKRRIFHDCLPVFWDRRDARNARQNQRLPTITKLSLKKLGPNGSSGSSAADRLAETHVHLDKHTSPT
jgi:hypothetical protein